MKTTVGKVYNALLQPESKFSISSVLLSLVGSIILGLFVPWSEVFSSSIPGGGDNPAHLVLMQSIKESFFSHLSLVHYSYSFWGGFEVFQFYFPLPYLIAAILSCLFSLNVAFKIVTLFAVLAVPFAFYQMGRSLKLSRVACLLASVFGVCFFYTQAHVMWGGNVYSTLAGMIGNSWAFVFFILSFGQLIDLYQRHSFSLLTVIFLVLAMMSHFYAILMIFVLFAVFGAQDLIKLFHRQIQFKQLLPFYSMGFFAVLLMCWWILPLIFYHSFSSDFGGNWEVKLLETFSGYEKAFFGYGFILALLLVSKNFSNSKLTTVILFSVFSLLLYGVGGFINSTAFINIRLWPTLYFSFYVLAIVVFDALLTRISMISSVVVVCLVWFLLPDNQAFSKATSWFSWNYEGLESKPAWEDFSKIVEILKTLPQGRVSFESDDLNNGILGSVRTFEMIPYLTQHAIVEGGIVNSATFPGIGYNLQCLTSNNCAGWPPGSIMPTKDFPRAISLMRALGVNYHIASAQENRELIKDTQEVQSLYEGKHLALYQLKDPSSLVEVYDHDLPVLKLDRPHITLLALPRYDALRETGLIIDSSLVGYPESSAIINPVEFVNFLNKEWKAGRSVKDRGWESRAKDRKHYLNTYLFALRNSFNLEQQLKKGPNIFLADRGFDPDVIISNQQEGYSEVGVPLVKKGSSQGIIQIAGSGYQVFLGKQELKVNSENIVSFTKGNSEKELSYAVLTLRPILTSRYRYLDLTTEDPSIDNGLPGNSDLIFPQKITASCDVQVKQDYHRLILHTKCPGKPHLVKYSYYPKWKTEVPIYMGTNGYMMLTPQKETTLIEHKLGIVDYFGIGLSSMGLVFAGSVGCYMGKKGSRLCAG